MLARFTHLKYIPTTLPLIPAKKLSSSIITTLLSSFASGALYKRYQTTKNSDISYRSSAYALLDSNKKLVSYFNHPGIIAPPY